MPLTALPEELHLEIVDHLANSYQHKNRIDIAGLRNLSTTCAAFNFACAHVIFQTYHLDIRNSVAGLRDKSYPRGSTVHTWDHGAIKVRLAHLQSKAPFVRRIYITDEGDWNSTTNAFPPTFIPELLSTLRMLSAVTEVHLITHSHWVRPNAMIDTDLWKWIVEVGPRKLLLDGHFEIPKGENLQPVKDLSMFGLHSCTNITKRLIHVSLSMRSDLDLSMICFHNSATQTSQFLSYLYLHSRLRTRRLLPLQAY